MLEQTDSDSQRLLTQSVPGLPPNAVDADDFEKAFGEPLSQTIDLDTWRVGADLTETYARMEREVAQAVQQERRMRTQVRNLVFDRLRNGPNAFPGSGVYQATLEEIERVHRGLLFNGAVEACDGISIPHDTLPLTIVQIGVCLVSYRGDQGSWAQRLYRRDLRISSGDPVQEMLGVLENRRTRGSTDAPDPRDLLTELARRSIMTYAERAVLAHKSRALWRMGHGNPVPFELLTGGGLVREGVNGGPKTNPLLRASLEVLRSLLLEHRRFVFVPSAPSDRMLLTIGHALRPLEFAIARTIEPQLERLIVDPEGYFKGIASEGKLVRDFARDVGPNVVVGVYRATDYGPPYLFYAHRENACEAALIALADSVLQEHRSFPTLIDLADTVCRTVFGVDSFLPEVRLAYTDAGEPWRYEGERGTRR